MSTAENSNPVEAPVSDQNTAEAPEYVYSPTDPSVPTPEVEEAMRLMQAAKDLAEQRQKLVELLPEEVTEMDNMIRFKDVHFNDQEAILVAVAHLAQVEKAQGWNEMTTLKQYASFLRNFAIDKDRFDSMCSGLDARRNIALLSVAWLGELKK